jgi:propanol-preferring alcohol dehydrogenase
MRAAVVNSFDRPLTIEDVPIPEPGPEQVLVRIETCGLCHTDIHAAHGVGPGNPHGLAVGMRVALPWLGYACGDCVYCNSGRQTLCAAQLDTGYSFAARFAEYAIGYARHAVRVPDGIDPADAVPLTCAGVTTYKAVKVSGTTSSSLVAVFGVGGLGHLAVPVATT